MHGSLKSTEHVQFYVQTGHKFMIKYSLLLDKNSSSSFWSQLRTTETLVLTLIMFSTVKCEG